jgi:SAM-dependent MidA family methyltransferase
LRCYLDHEIIENIYDFIGECDITASVNFTALKVYGEYNGFKSLPLVKQGQFLQNLGIVDEIINKKLNIIDQYKLGNAIKTLFYPNGMGEIFKVLIQYKGINKPIISGV